MGTATHDITWPEVAALYPEFTQWVVATYGPLPDGEVRKADYDRFAEAYYQAHPDRWEV